MSHILEIKRDVKALNSSTCSNVNALSYATVAKTGVDASIPRIMLEQTAAKRKEESEKEKLGGKQDGEERGYHEEE